MWSGKVPNHYFDAPVRDPIVGPGGLVTDAWIAYFNNQPLWDDLRFPAQGLNPPGAVSDPGVDNSSTFMGTLLFDAASTELIAGVAQLPHSWKIGSTISPHIHWCPTNTNTGNVAWRFSYQIAPINSTFPASLTTAGIEVDAADGTANKHQIHGFTDIDMSGYRSSGGVSIVIVWRIERVGGDASDTYNADARLLEFDIHYQTDGNGSKALFVK